VVRRSTLILPVNVQRFVERAHLRGADAVMLDLEDAVPPQQKERARRLVREAIPRVSRGGAEVLVRVNHLALLIETPRGLLNLEAIAAASGRIRTISLGPEDYCLELGVEPSADGAELHYALARVVTVCKAAGMAPMGLLGSIAGFRDLAAFERAAARASHLGCVGASCIHPDQVAVLNRVFSPPPEKVEYARRAAEAFEAGLRNDTASVSVDGAMVDTPVYRRAKRILEQAAAIAEVEQRKAAALARLT
jgi:citrate lyase subunit beta/citryl-CoA lyase